MSSIMPVDRRCAGLLVTLTLVCLVPASHGQSAPGPALVPDHAVIGKVGSEQITSDDIVAQDKDAFDALKNRRESKLRLLELDYASSYHELVQKQLDQLLDRRALELEAAARGTTAAALLAEVKAPVVTDDEALAFYAERKEEIHAPFGQVATEIKQVLAQQHNEAAMRSFYDELRRKHAVTSLLEPYRVAVAATGPARGKATAAVTIVEFADFQCPYCRDAEASLREVINKHPNDVRLVFRNRPLTQLHPNAMLAARAAVCADRQGRFWEMHDAMFSDQTALSVDALKSTAARLGLDKERFDTCLDNAQDTDKTLGEDAQAAADLGVNSTPYFFIDGRPLRGSAAPEQFERIIDDELSRRSTGAGQGS
jgi:protein-disulfide isomerase